jgi:hypothetical protein
MGRPRKKRSTREEVLDKIERAGISTDELQDALAIFYLEAVEDGLHAAAQGRTCAESLMDSIVACSDVFRAEDEHPNDQRVERCFQHLRGAAEELVQAAEDKYFGEVAAVVTRLGIPLQARDLADVIRLARERAKVTYAEIAVLLVDGLPKYGKLVPEHRVRQGESREDAIDRVDASLRKRVSRARK